MLCQSWPALTPVLCCGQQWLMCCVVASTDSYVVLWPAMTPMLCCGQHWLLCCVVASTDSYVVLWPALTPVLCCGQHWLLCCVVASTDSYFVLWPALTPMLCCGQHWLLCCVVAITDYCVVLWPALTPMLCCGQLWLQCCVVASTDSCVVLWPALTPMLWLSNKSGSKFWQQTFSLEGQSDVWRNVLLFLLLEGTAWWGEGVKQKWQHDNTIYMIMTNLSQIFAKIKILAKYSQSLQIALATKPLNQLWSDTWYFITLLSNLIWNQKSTQSFCSWYDSQKKSWYKKTNRQTPPPGQFVLQKGTVHKSRR